MLLKQYKHILWDWNGTLFDDVYLCIDIINKILFKRNIETLSVEKYKQIFTFPVKDYYALAGFDFSKYPFELVGKEWVDEYERRKLECGLHNKAVEVLNLFAQLSINQSILSAYSQKKLIQIIKYFNLTTFFSNISGLDHIYATSKVEIGKQLLKKINYEKNEVLLIGDTIHDYDVAKQLGIDCLLISNGHQAKSRLLSCNVPMLENLMELHLNLLNV
jgi:phosphoglycolate phosphatase